MSRNTSIQQLKRKQIKVKQLLGQYKVARSLDIHKQQTIQWYREYIQNMQEASKKYYQSPMMPFPKHYENLKNSILNITTGKDIGKGVKYLEKLSDADVSMGVMFIDLVISNFKYIVAYNEVCDILLSYSNNSDLVKNDIKKIQQYINNSNPKQIPKLQNTQLDLGLQNIISQIKKQKQRHNTNNNEEMHREFENRISIQVKNCKQNYEKNLKNIKSQMKKIIQNVRQLKNEIEQLNKTKILGTIKSMKEQIQKMQSYVVKIIQEKPQQKQMDNLIKFIDHQKIECERILQQFGNFKNTKLMSMQSTFISEYSQ